MNKKFKEFLYLFVIATLFLVLQSTMVYAINPSELIAGHTVLRYKSSETTRDGEALLSYQVIKLPFKKSDVIFDEETGTIRLPQSDGGNDYISFKIYYTTPAPSSESLTQTPSIGTDEDGNVFLRLTKEIPVGSTYKLSVIESIEGEDEKGKSTFNERITSTVEKEFTIDSDNLPIDEFKRTGWLDAGWSALRGDLSKIGKILLETFCDIIVPAGDAFLDMICNSVGEVVTIDRIVYNKIDKLDIDFFEKSSGDASFEGAKLSTPLKSTLGNAVDKLYVFFRNIVVVFFMIILLYIGVNILMTTTAERRSDYKSIFMSWVLGVIMLMFFPFVIKYTIRLNNSLCNMIGEKEVVTTSRKINGLSTRIYGTDDFVKHMLSDGETTNDNAMLNVRYIGANSANIPLIIVYFIFIGQLLAMLILYYKRVFMVAFLISIFPIVAAVYPLCRIGAINMNPFGMWFKEFVINVFVQSFHAATYKVIVTIGVISYINHGNWLFLMMCVLFLFEGEKMIRAIFNAKSSANTIGNMAMAGAIAMKFMKSAGNVIPTANNKSKDSKSDDELAKEKARKDVSSTPTQGAETNKRAVENISSSKRNSNNGNVVATDVSVQIKPISNSSVSNNNANTVSAVDKKIEKEKSENKGGKLSKIASGVAGTTFNIGSQVTGGIIGTTYGLAQNNTKDGFNSTASGFVSGLGIGKTVGSSGKTFLSNRIEKSSAKKAALITAARYNAGEFDDEIGINEADKQLNEERAKAIRKAYARYAKRSVGWRGKTGAQLSFYKEQMKILNESVERNKD